jgi:hypothetical protein
MASARRPAADRVRLARNRAQLISATEAGREYYATHTHPAYNMFGTPDFVDTDGREYRLAFHVDGGRELAVTALIRLRAARAEHTRATMDDLLVDQVARAIPTNTVVTVTRDAPSASRVRLWVRLPKSRGGRAPRTWPVANTRLELLYRADAELTRGGEEASALATVANAVRSTQQRATGYVDVVGIAPDVADTILARRVEQARRRLAGDDM